MLIGCTNSFFITRYLCRHVLMIFLLVCLTTWSGKKGAVCAHSLISKSLRTNSFDIKFVFCFLFPICVYIWNVAKILKFMKWRHIICNSPNFASVKTARGFFLHRSKIDMSVLTGTPSSSSEGHIQAVGKTLMFMLLYETAAPVSVI
jgi:hypothetical protein